MNKLVCVGADQRGALVRETVVNLLKKRGYTCEIVGSRDADDVVDYPDIVSAITPKIASGEACFGVLVCGTGVGVLMGANKAKGVRAVLGDSLERIYFARKHEDANCLVLAGGYTDGHKTISSPTYKFLEQAIIEFETTKFEAGRHIARVEKLNNL